MAEGALQKARHSEFVATTHLDITCTYCSFGKTLPILHCLEILKKFTKKSENHIIWAFLFVEYY